MKMELLKPGVPKVHLSLIGRKSYDVLTLISCKEEKEEKAKEEEGCFQ